jgi:hypothetical protein
MILNSRRLLDLSTNLRLPAMYQTGQSIEDGGLMRYGVNYGDLYRRAAIYIDKIIRGQGVRLTGRTSDETRTNYQSESGQANRCDHSAQCFG